MDDHINRFEITVKELLGMYLRVAAGYDEAIYEKLF